MAFYPIKVEGTRVEVKLTATTGWEFTFVHECGHAGWAELLAESLRKKRDVEDTSSYENAYKRGWADAKAKRAKAIA